jgi:hypothetical protein
VGTMRLDDDDDHGTPQPATQAMSQAEAINLQERTNRQLMAFLHGDGKWYCYDARPAHQPLGIQPKVPPQP